MIITDRTQFLTDGNPVEELTVEGSRFDRISILVDDGTNQMVVRAREVGTGDVVEQPLRKVSGQLFKPVTPVETHRRDVDDDIQDALASIGYAPVDERMLDADE